MNFQNMEYFLAAAREGNITRAAARLQISQQALSNAISRLEEELGCRLFERRPGLSLTYSGRRYRAAALKMLDMYKQTLSLLHDIDQDMRGELRVGVAYTRGQAILPLILPAFHKKYPRVDLSVIEESTRDLEQRLEQGELDVMIGFAPFFSEHAESCPLMTDRLFLVLPRELLGEHFGPEAPAVLERFRAEHDLRLFQDLPFVLLEERDRIRTLVDQAFTQCGMVPDICFVTRNTQTAVALAAEGVGITVCPGLYLNSPYTASGDPKSYIRRRVEICPLFDGSAPDTIAIGYNKNRYLSPFARDFIDMSREAMAARSGPG